jgi:hypothetical protein
MAEDNNQSAPEVVTSDKATEAAPQNAASTAGQGTESKATSNAQPQESAFDPRTNYDALKSQFENLNKSYSELRRTYTQSSQGYSDLKKQLDGLVKAFQDASQEEVSPEEFMKALQSQGIKAFDPLRQKWTSEVREQYDKALDAIRQERLGDRVELEVMKRRYDSQRYPDFDKLLPVMQELAQDDNCPVNWNQDVGLIYDTLYKLAKASSAENAIKEAHALGVKDAEGKVAKEAGSAVATGGKAGSVTNPADIKDVSKLREYFVAQLGEAE